MPSVSARFRRSYGAGPLHALLMLASLALAAYAVTKLGFLALWNPDVWWQSVAVWFFGAVILHDLVLYPAYALLDRFAVHTSRRGLLTTSPVPVANHIRAPLLLAGMTFLVFFPSILEHGASTYTAATGQTQEPFLRRWLLLSAAGFLLSAALYVVRLGRATRQTGSGAVGFSARRPAAPGSRADRNPPRR